MSRLDLAPATAVAQLIDAHGSDASWLDAFADAFERQRSGHELERILRVWGLSQTEAGHMFGVTRQAVAKWLDQGVPSERAVKIADVGAATDLLVRHLKRDRIHAVVRRVAPALGGLSLMAVFATGDTSRLLKLTRAMFTFGDAHA